MKISSLLAASVCAGMLVACNDQSQPDEDPELYRAQLSTRILPPHEIQPVARSDRYFYQTEEFVMTEFRHDNGTIMEIGMLGCVFANTEITRQEFTENRDIRVTLVNEETGAQMTGTIGAANLYRAAWMDLENCNAWVLETEGDIPAAERGINPSSPGPSPI